MPLWSQPPLRGYAYRQDHVSSRRWQKLDKLTYRPFLRMNGVFKKISKEKQNPGLPEMLVAGHDEKD